MSQTSSLPVLMYHYINRRPDSIAVSPELFASHCEALALGGWRGVGLAEAEAYFLHGEPLPKKSCLITFDDGYLDNYVYAWPILQKFGHKGVIFAVSGKMETEEILRPTIADVWAQNIEADALPQVDDPFVRHENGYDVRQDLFFSWREAREMEKSGVMAVASHTLEHRGVFTTSRYNGFFMPEKRSRTFHDPATLFWGTPKFVMGPGLAERAFLLNPEAAEKIKALTPQNDAEAYAFAADDASMRALKNLVDAYGENLGRMETDQETADRTAWEIGEGKRVLEQGLGHSVVSLCWPWGAYNELSLAVAKGAGFSVFFITQQGANPPGQALAVRRFKAKANDASWLTSRARLYSRPLLATFYAKAQFRTPGKGSKKKSFVIRRQ